MGGLCLAWSVLEARTEATLWGILGADNKLGPVITWRLDIRGRWQMILEYAPNKHNKEDINELKTINSILTPIMRDRNIIIHGLVHSTMKITGPTTPKSGSRIAEPYVFVQPPCWTVFRGKEAGKNFPVSAQAVEIVCANILKITGTNCFVQ